MKPAARDDDRAPFGAPFFVAGLGARVPCGGRIPYLCAATGIFILKCNDVFGVLIYFTVVSQLYL